MPVYPGRALAGLALAATLLLVPAVARDDDVLVFAAASLKTALDAVAEDWRARTGKQVVVSYAGSSSLARQIERGAPADIFISASTDWMDFLEQADQIEPATRRNLLGNSLVLVAHGPNAPVLSMDSNTDLAGLLGDRRLAMALVDSVPAGVYGKQALVSLGQWDAVADRVAQADNVRAALALVSSGEAPYGIVYASDAVSDDTVSVVAEFPSDSHDPIVYPAAIVGSSDNRDAGAFLEALGSPEAAIRFEAQGFVMLTGRGDG